jgi:hypothetical protein
MTVLAGVHRMRRGGPARRLYDPTGRPVHSHRCVGDGAWPLSLLLVSRSLPLPPPLHVPPLTPPRFPHADMPLGGKLLRLPEKENVFSLTVRLLGDAKISLGDAKSSLGDAESSLGGR